MDIEYQLSDTITRTLESQCARAVRHKIAENEKNTEAILFEWVLDNGECVLTRYLDENTDGIKETLIYIKFEDDKLIEGQFWFNPEEILPGDNN